MTKTGRTTTEPLPPRPRGTSKLIPIIDYLTKHSQQAQPAKENANEP